MNKIIYLSCLVLAACLPQSAPSQSVSKEFKNYWYDNSGEISSYELSIARYGELRTGKAVMVFVTENYSPELGAKPDAFRKDQVPVLKLNTTMNFHTGIYPYSIMTSSFLPVETPKHSLKISSSIQEWCGHSYMELRNGKKMKVKVSSYFEGENMETVLDKTWMEDDFYSIIRVDPEALPIGTKKVIPAFNKLRMSHLELIAYTCKLSLSKHGNHKVYALVYPELGRTLKISFEDVFPYRILGWEEIAYSGYGSGKQQLTSTATLINTIQLPYWQKNKNKDALLRKELGL